MGRMVVHTDLNERSQSYVVLRRVSLMVGEHVSYIVESRLSEEMK